ncbi:MAG: hypothetical protein WBN80_06480, partial [Prochlorococcaceae cyanobacterium]
SLANRSGLYRDALRDILTAIHRVQGFPIPDLETFLAMDITTGLEEIESRMTARAFSAVHNPEQGAAVRQVSEQLLEILDLTSPDGVI